MDIELLISRYGRESNISPGHHWRELRMSLSRDADPHTVKYGCGGPPKTEEGKQAEKFRQMENNAYLAVFVDRWKDNTDIAVGSKPCLACVKAKKTCYRQLPSCARSVRNGHGDLCTYLESAVPANYNVGIARQRIHQRHRRIFTMSKNDSRYLSYAASLNMSLANLGTPGPQGEQNSFCSQ